MVTVLIGVAFTQNGMYVRILADHLISCTSVVVIENRPYPNSGTSIPFIASHLYYYLSEPR